MVRTAHLRLAVILISGLGLASAGPPPTATLAEYVAPTGALWCALPAGGVAVLEGRSGPVRLWDAGGRPRGVIEVTSAPDGAAPIASIASQTHLALLWKGVDGGLVVQLFSLPSRSRVRELRFPSSAVTVTLGPSTLVMEGLSVDEVAPVQVFDLKGQALATYPLPAELIQSVQGQTGSTWLAHVRTFFHGRELWGIPGGVYELWRLGKAPFRVEVAAARRVSGNHLTGEAAARRYQERGIPPGPGRASALVEPAVRQVSPRGDRVAVLLEDRPAAESGRCRVDFWRFPGPKPGASIRVPGSCPDAVYQGDHGLWLRRRGRVEWEQLPAADR